MYISTQDNIAAFADDGVQLNLLWQTEIYGNSSFSLMTMGADGTVFVPSDGGIIRLDPQNGSVLKYFSVYYTGRFLLTQTVRQQVII
jgi:uncharacterized protein (AIM24 family)